MFESLGEKLSNAFKKFRSKGKLTESDVKEGMREINIKPIRTPSAPYLAINSNGSGELPNDFDILRPNLSRTIPVK